jgi:hypothetical protein
MKTLLVGILMVLILLGPAYAGSGRAVSYLGSSSGPITQNLTIVNTRGTNIYTMTLTAYSSYATLTIYDANALASGALAPNELPIYEVEVATANSSSTVDFSTAPLQTYTGLIASVSNGVAYINKE